MYRVGKFARRNLTLLIGATTVLLSLFAVSVSIVLVSLSQRRQTNNANLRTDGCRSSEASMTP